MQRLKKEHDVLFNVCTRTASAFINQESTILNWRVGTERPTRVPQDELSRNDEECAQQANITTPSPHDDWPLRSKQHEKSTIPAIHRAGIYCCECDLFLQESTCFAERHCIVSGWGSIRGLATPLRRMRKGRKKTVTATNNYPPWSSAH